MKSFVPLFFFMSLLIGLRVTADDIASRYTIMPRIEHIAAYPCSQCHTHFGKEVVERDFEKNHGAIFFKHMPEVKKCSLCHSPKNPNQLNLLDGTLVSYDESYRLCRQCHGKMAYNWQRGLHGSLAGHWDGQRMIVNCSTCHNPHNPPIKQSATFAEPAIPKFLIDKNEGKTEGEH